MNNFVKIFMILAGISFGIAVLISLWGRAVPSVEIAPIFLNIKVERWLQMTEIFLLSAIMLILLKMGRGREG